MSITCRSMFSSVQRIEWLSKYSSTPGHAPEYSHTISVSYTPLLITVFVCLSVTFLAVHFVVYIRLAVLFIHHSFRCLCLLLALRLWPTFGTTMYM